MIKVRIIALYAMIISIISMKVVIADIPSQEFKEILHVIKTYDLDGADKDGFNYYISLIMKIDDEGSEEQKNILDRTLQTEPETKTSDNTIDTAINDIQETLQHDVISKASWNNVIHNIAIIEEQGSLAQQAIIQGIISTETTQNAMRNMIVSTLQSIDVQDLLKSITIGTLYGVLPAVALKSAALLAGNIDPMSAGTALVDLGVLSALDSLARYATQRTPLAASASLAGGASIAIQGFWGYAGERPLDLPVLGPLGRPLLGMIQAAGLTLLQQELARRGGIDAIITNLNWRDVAFGPEEGAIVQESSIITILKNKLSLVIQNETARRAVVTTASYAVEGALMGAVMYALGIGFYEESTLAMALSQSMLRGALEGLYVFSAYKDKPLGLVQRLQSGFAARTFQQTLIQSGVRGISALSITPIIVQQLSVSAVNSVVRTSGGWGNLVRKIFAKKQDQ